MYPNEENLSYYMKEVKKIDSDTRKKIKIAILSSFTITGLAETIKVKCRKFDVDCISYESGYNQFNQEILNTNSDLYKFNPEITFLILDSKNIFHKYIIFF